MNVLGLKMSRTNLDPKYIGIEPARNASKIFSDTYPGAAVFSITRENRYVENIFKFCPCLSLPKNPGMGKIEGGRRPSSNGSHCSGEASGFGGG